MPVKAAPPSDPRSIITPDAFEVSSALLGTPLASPRRRLAALVANLANLYQMTSPSSGGLGGSGASSKPTLERLVMATAPDDFDTTVLHLGQ